MLVTSELETNGTKAVLKNLLRNLLKRICSRFTFEKIFCSESFVGIIFSTWEYCNWKLFDEFCRLEFFFGWLLTINEIRPNGSFQIRWCCFFSDLSQPTSSVLTTLLWFLPLATLTVADFITNTFTIGINLKTLSLYK